MSSRYQLEIIEKEKTMSNEDLLNEVLTYIGWDAFSDPDDDMRRWEYGYLLERLVSRLNSWLKEDKKCQDQTLN
jgi:hypothetical protein